MLYPENVHPPMGFQVSWDHADGRCGIPRMAIGSVSHSKGVLCTCFGFTEGMKDYRPHSVSLNFAGLEKMLSRKRGDPTGALEVRQN